MYPRFRSMFEAHLVLDCRNLSGDKTACTQDSCGRPKIFINVRARTLALAPRVDFFEFSLILFPSSQGRDWGIGGEGVPPGVIISESVDEDAIRESGRQSPGGGNLLDMVPPASGPIRDLLRQISSDGECMSPVRQGEAIDWDSE